MRALALALLATAASAQPADPFELLRLSYVAVFDGPAFAFGLDVTEASDGVAPETWTAEVVAWPEPDSGLSWFTASLGAGEVSRVAFDGETYQVEFPRTRAVYVDSTAQELGSGLDAYFAFHPLFGIGLHLLTREVDAAYVVGPDKVGGRPCTRAVFEGAGADGALDLSVCFDAARAVPSEVVVRAPGETSTLRVRGLRTVAAESEGFVLDTPDGFRRLPYQQDGPLLAVGAEAPGLSLPGEGGALDLGALRGRYVLLDFWGTWCPPCVEAIPEVEALAEAYPDLAVVALAAYEAPEDDPEAFVRERGGTYPVALADEPTLEAYRVTAFPTYYLLDPDGRVVFGAVPSREPDAEGALRARLAEAFPQPRAASE